MNASYCDIKNAEEHDQAWIARESENLGFLSSHVYERSYMAGHVGVVDLSLFAVTEEHTIEAYSVRLLPTMVW